MAVISKLEKVIQLACVRLTPMTRLVHSKSDLKISKIHITSRQEYPAVKQIPLPTNVEDINSNEKSRFSPERNRDISGSLISSSTGKSDFKVLHSVTSPSDSRVASYDCSGAVSLNSAMQTNVPDPFVANGNEMHLNMPGGQWSQDQKYVSDDLNNSHHVNTRATPTGIGASFTELRKPRSNGYLMSASNGLFTGLSVKDIKLFSTEPGKLKEDETKEVVLSKKEKLKAAVKEYGSVVIVFHVAISLTSLGICYLLVTSGIDFSSILGKWESLDGAATNTAAPFIVAYAIHKTMAPLRITATLVSVPFIVKYLRKVGIIKRAVGK